MLLPLFKGKGTSAKSLADRSHPYLVMTPALSMSYWLALSMAPLGEPFLENKIFLLKRIVFGKPGTQGALKGDIFKGDILKGDI